MKRNLNLWELLKASKGIPVADPMAVLWGQQYRKKHGIAEISGVLPLEFTSRGEQLLDYRIYGNTVQDGTPAPENPAEVQGVGEQTENLFDKDTAVVYVACITSAGKWFYANDSRSIRIQVKPNTQYTLSTEGIYTIFRILEIQSDDVPTEQNRYPQMSSILIVFGENQSHYTFETSENAKYIVFQSNLSVVNNWLNELMLVEGNSIRSDYIPYGYKIPVVAINGMETVTTPVYIGSEPLHKIGDYADYVDYKRGVVVRNIEKLVLTDETNVTDASGNAPYRIDTKKLRISKSYIYWCCSHYEGVTAEASWKEYNYCISWHPRDKNNDALRFRDVSVSDVSEFKSFISAQYSAGTPVTVWYVLDTPKEEPLENLLPIQTIKGSDILTVDTTIQPSEMYIKYKKG